MSIEILFRNGLNDKAIIFIVNVTLSWNDIVLWR